MEIRSKLITDYHFLSRPVKLVTARKSNSQLDLRKEFRPWRGAIIKYPGPRFIGGREIRFHVWIEKPLR